MNLASIILLLQTVLSLMTQPNMAQNVQIQAMANQAIQMAQVALSESSLTQNATSSITYLVPQGDATNTQPITINVTNPPNTPLLGATNPIPSSTPIFSKVNIGRGSFDSIGNSNTFEAYQNHKEGDSIFLYDQNGNPIVDATATIAINGGVPMDLSLLHIYNNGNPFSLYQFQYSFPNVGSSTMEVNALGVTKTIQLTVLPEY